MSTYAILGGRHFELVDVAVQGLCSDLILFNTFDHDVWGLDQPEFGLHDLGINDFLLHLLVLLSLLPDIGQRVEDNVDDGEYGSKDTEYVTGLLPSFVQQVLIDEAAGGGSRDHSKGKGGEIQS